MYAEGEYTHDCSSIWPDITYGDKNHWRNIMPSTFYCTHSIGPILYMTGLRPVSVTSFEAPPRPFLTNVGYTAGAYFMIVLTLENGALFKSLQFNLKHNRPGNNYQLNGDLGALKDMGDRTLSAYIEEEKNAMESRLYILRRIFLPRRSRPVTAADIIARPICLSEAYLETRRQKNTRRMCTTRWICVFWES